MHNPVQRNAERRVRLRPTPDVEPRRGRVVDLPEWQVAARVAATARAARRAALVALAADSALATRHATLAAGVATEAFSTAAHREAATSRRG